MLAMKSSFGRSKYYVNKMVWWRSMMVTTKYRVHSTNEYPFCKELT